MIATELPDGRTERTVAVGLLPIGQEAFFGPGWRSRLLRLCGPDFGCGPDLGARELYNARYLRINPAESDPASKFGMGFVKSYVL